MKKLKPKLISNDLARWDKLVEPLTVPPCWLELRKVERRWNANHHHGQATVIRSGHGLTDSGYRVIFVPERSTVCHLYHSGVTGSTGQRGSPSEIAHFSMLAWESISTRVDSTGASTTLPSANPGGGCGEERCILYGRQKCKYTESIS